MPPVDCAGFLVDGENVAQAVAVPVAELDALPVAADVENLVVAYPVGDGAAVLEKMDVSGFVDPEVVVVASSVHVAVVNAILY